MKRCSKCKQWKTLEEFRPDRRNRDGKRSECKSCQQIKINEWNEKNKEWRKLRDAEYHKKHYHKGYRREYRQRYYQENKERIKEQQKQYTMNHRDEARLKTIRYRHKKLELECTLNKEQWEIIKLAFRHRCAYCGKRTTRLEREHIIPVSAGGGFTLNNIVPACRQCNAKKQNNLPVIPVKLVLL